MRWASILLIILLVVSTVGAVSVTQTGTIGTFIQNVFTTGNSEENITFDGVTLNNTLYINLSQKIEISDAFITFAGNKTVAGVEPQYLYATFGEGNTQHWMPEFENLYYDPGADNPWDNVSKWTEVWSGKTTALNPRYQTANVQSNSANCVVSNAEARVNRNNMTKVTAEVLETGSDSIYVGFTNSTPIVSVNANEDPFVGNESIFLKLNEGTADVFYANSSGITQVGNSGTTLVDNVYTNISIELNFTGNVFKVYQNDALTATMTNTGFRALYTEGPIYYTLCQVSGGGTFSTLKWNNVTFNDYVDYAEGYNKSELVTFKRQAADALASCTPDDAGYCNMPVTLWSNSTGNASINIGSSITYSSVYNFTYDNETIEKDLEVFNLTVYNVLINDGFMVYNNTNRTTTQTNFSDRTQFISNLRTDWVIPGQLNQTNPITWNITFANGTNDTTANADQQVHRIYINATSTCDSSQKAINFSIRNQTSNALLSPSSFNIYLEAYHDSSTYFRNYSSNFTGSSSYSLCIYPSWANYTVNAQADYSYQTLPTKLYYLNNAVLNNITQYINLFLTGGTSTVTFTVNDLDDTAIEDVEIQILSYDIGTNTFTTSEILETDDSGVALGQLVLGNWYKFLLYYQGDLVLETAPSIVNSATKNFRVSFGDDYLTDNYDIFNGVVHTLTFNNVSKTFDFTWTQSDGTAVDACLKVIRSGVLGNIELTNQCTSSVSGTHLYSITENTTGSTYIATSYIQDSNNASIFVLDTLTQTYEDQYKTWGLSGVFATFFIMVFLVMASIWSPIVAVFMAVGTIALASIMKIFYLSWGVMVAFIIMAVITIYRLNK